MSVRRTRPVTARSHEDELPELLRAPCWCEDRLDPDEQPRPWATVDTPEDLAFHLSLIARRRWKAARLPWAEDRGMTWQQFSGTYAHGSPRWRDWPAYAARRTSAAQWVSTSGLGQQLERHDQQTTQQENT